MAEKIKLEIQRNLSIKNLGISPALRRMEEITIGDFREFIKSHKPY